MSALGIMFMSLIVIGILFFAGLPLWRAWLPLCFMGLHDDNMVFPKKGDEGYLQDSLNYRIQCSHCKRYKR